MNCTPNEGMLWDHACDTDKVQHQARRCLTTQRERPFKNENHSSQCLGNAGGFKVSVGEVPVKQTCQSSCRQLRPPDFIIYKHLDGILGTTAHPLRGPPLSKASQQERNIHRMRATINEAARRYSMFTPPSAPGSHTQ